MTFYYFYPCLLLSRAPLHKHFLGTCCFNDLDYQVYGHAIRCQRPVAQVNFYLYFYAIKSK